MPKIHQVQTASTSRGRTEEMPTLKRIAAGSSGPLSRRALLLLFVSTGACTAQVRTATDTVLVNYPAVKCPNCEAWNASQPPFRVSGNTYYVGTRGLSSILITSDSGHILIDGGLPASAEIILANIRTLGFDPRSVKVIVNSHVHYDHAGGIADLQRATGATVLASAWSATVLRSGMPNALDPQYDADPDCRQCALPFPAARSVREIRDGDSLRIGPVQLIAHMTPGHTPGGTSWTWRSCDAGRCVDLLYADSQTPISVEGFLYTRNSRYPTAIEDFTRGINVLERLPCTILLTPHPGSSSLFQRIAARDSGNVAPLHDSGLCRKFVADARAALARRIAVEQNGR